MFEMDFSALSSELQNIASRYNGRDTDPAYSTTMYCEMFHKILQKTETEVHEYADQIVILWMTLSQLCNTANTLAPCPARDGLYQDIFLQCAKTVLNIKWQNLAEDDQSKENFIETVKATHVQLVTTGFDRFSLLLHLMENPWTDPTLSEIMSGEADNNNDAVQEYIRKESPVILKLRVEMLKQENCEEFALNLCNTLMGHEVFEKDMELRETQLLLLHKLNQMDKLQEVCEKIVCHDGIKLILKLECKESNQALSVRLVQLFLVQDWINPDQNCCTQELLKLWIRHQYIADRNKEKFLDSVWAIAKLSLKTQQILTLVGGLQRECGTEMIQLYTDLCVYAINVDKGCCEQQMLQGNMDGVKERQHAIAQTCRKLSALFSNTHPKISRISSLTAFALDASLVNLCLVERIFNKRYCTHSKKECSACTKAFNSVTKCIGDTKVNPATLYEVERLLNMLRPYYLNPDLAWKELLPICQKFMKERGQSSLESLSESSNASAKKSTETKSKSKKSTPKKDTPGKISYYCDDNVSYLSKESASKLKNANQNFRLKPTGSANSCTQTPRQEVAGQHSRNSTSANKTTERMIEGTAIFEHQKQLYQYNFKRKAGSSCGIFGETAQKSASSSIVQHGLQRSLQPPPAHTTHTANLPSTALLQNAALKCQTVGMDSTGQPVVFEVPVNSDQSFMALSTQTSNNSKVTVVTPVHPRQQTVYIRDTDSQSSTASAYLQIPGQKVQHVKVNKKSGQSIGELLQATKVMPSITSSNFDNFTLDPNQTNYSTADLLRATKNIPQISRSETQTVKSGKDTGQTSKAAYAATVLGFIPASQPKVLKGLTGNSMMLSSDSPGCIDKTAAIGLEPKILGISKKQKTPRKPRTSTSSTPQQDRAERTQFHASNQILPNHFGVQCSSVQTVNSTSLTTQSHNSASRNLPLSANNKGEYRSTHTVATGIKLNRDPSIGAQPLSSVHPSSSSLQTTQSSSDKNIHRPRIIPIRSTSNSKSFPPYSPSVVAVTSAILSPDQVASANSMTVNPVSVSATSMNLDIDMYDTLRKGKSAQPSQQHVVVTAGKIEGYRRPSADELKSIVDWLQTGTEDDKNKELLQSQTSTSHVVVSAQQAVAPTSAAVVSIAQSSLATPTVMSSSSILSSASSGVAAGVDTTQVKAFLAQPHTSSSKHKNVSLTPEQLQKIMLGLSQRQKKKQVKTIPSYKPIKPQPTPGIDANVGGSVAGQLSSQKSQVQEAKPQTLGLVNSIAPNTGTTSVTRVQTIPNQNVSKTAILPLSTATVVSQTTLSTDQSGNPAQDGPISNVQTSQLNSAPQFHVSGTKALQLLPNSPSTRVYELQYLGQINPPSKTLKPKDGASITIATSPSQSENSSRNITSMNSEPTSDGGMESGVKMNHPLLVPKTLSPEEELKVPKLPLGTLKVVEKSPQTSALFAINGDSAKLTLDNRTSSNLTLNATERNALNDVQPNTQESGVSGGTVLAQNTPVATSSSLPNPKDTPFLENVDTDSYSSVTDNSSGVIDSFMDTCNIQTSTSFQRGMAVASEEVVKSVVNISESGTLNSDVVMECTGTESTESLVENSDATILQTNLANSSNTSDSPDSSTLLSHIPSAGQNSLTASSSNLNDSTQASKEHIDSAKEISENVQNSKSETHTVEKTNDTEISRSHTEETMEGVISEQSVQESSDVVKENLEHIPHTHPDDSLKGANNESEITVTSSSSMEENVKDSGHNVSLNDKLVLKDRTEQLGLENVSLPETSVFGTLVAESTNISAARSTEVDENQPCTNCSLDDNNGNNIVAGVGNHSALLDDGKNILASHVVSITDKPNQLNFDSKIKPALDLPDVSTRDTPNLKEQQFIGNLVSSDKQTPLDSQESQLESVDNVITLGMKVEESVTESQENPTVSDLPDKGSLVESKSVDISNLEDNKCLVESPGNSEMFGSSDKETLVQVDSAKNSVVLDSESPLKSEEKSSSIEFPDRKVSVESVLKLEDSRSEVESLENSVELRFQDSKSVVESSDSSAVLDLHKSVESSSVVDMQAGESVNESLENCAVVDSQEVSSPKGLDSRIKNTEQIKNTVDSQADGIKNNDLTVDTAENEDADSYAVNNNTIILQDLAVSGFDNTSANQIAEKQHTFTKSCENEDDNVEMSAIVSELTDKDEVTVDIGKKERSYQDVEPVASVNKPDSDYSNGESGPTNQTQIAGKVESPLDETEAEVQPLSVRSFDTKSEDQQQMLHEVFSESSQENLQRVRDLDEKMEHKGEFTYKNEQDISEKPWESQSNHQDTQIISKQDQFYQIDDVLQEDKTVESTCNKQVETHLATYDPNITKTSKNSENNFGFLWDNTEDHCAEKSSACIDITDQDTNKTSDTLTKDNETPVVETKSVSDLQSENLQDSESAEKTQVSNKGWENAFVSFIDNMGDKKPVKLDNGRFYGSKPMFSRQDSSGSESSSMSGGSKASKGSQGSVSSRSYRSVDEDSTGSCTKILPLQKRDNDIKRFEFFSTNTSTHKSANRQSPYRSLSGLSSQPITLPKVEVKPRRKHSVNLVQKNDMADSAQSKERQINKCIICAKTFRSVESLKCHVRNICRPVDIERPDANFKDFEYSTAYACVNCTVEFASKEEITSHLSECVGDVSSDDETKERKYNIKYKCRMCGEYFSCKDDVHSHVSRLCTKIQTLKQQQQERIDRKIQLTGKPFTDLWTDVAVDNQGEVFKRKREITLNEEIQIEETKEEMKIKDTNKAEEKEDSDNIQDLLPDECLPDSKFQENVADSIQSKDQSRKVHKISHSSPRKQWSLRNKTKFSSRLREFEFFSTKLNPGRRRAESLKRQEECHSLRNRTVQKHIRKRHINTLKSQQKPSESDVKNVKEEGNDNQQTTSSISKDEKSSENCTEKISVKTEENDTENSVEKMVNSHGSDSEKKEERSEVEINSPTVCKSRPSHTEKVLPKKMATAPRVRGKRVIQVGRKFLQDEFEVPEFLKTQVVNSNLKRKSPQQCLKCGQVFSNTYILIQHIVRVHMSPCKSKWNSAARKYQFQCMYCSDAFPTYVKFSKHVPVHKDKILRMFRKSCSKRRRFKNKNSTASNVESLQKAREIVRKQVKPPVDASSTQNDTSLKEESSTKSLSQHVENIRSIRRGRGRPPVNRTNEKIDTTRKERSGSRERDLLTVSGALLSDTRSGRNKRHDNDSFSVSSVDHDDDSASTCSHLTDKSSCKGRKNSLSTNFVKNRRGISEDRDSFTSEDSVYHRPITRHHGVAVSSFNQQSIGSEAAKKFKLENDSTNIVESKRTRTRSGITLNSTDCIPTTNIASLQIRDEKVLHSPVTRNKSKVESGQRKRTLNESHTQRRNLKKQSRGNSIAPETEVDDQSKKCNDLFDSGNESNLDNKTTRRSVRLNNSQHDQNKKKICLRNGAKKLTVMKKFDRSLVAKHKSIIARKKNNTAKKVHKDKTVSCLKGELLKLEKAESMSVETKKRNIATKDVLENEPGKNVKNSEIEDLGNKKSVLVIGEEDEEFVYVKSPLSSPSISPRKSQQGDAPANSQEKNKSAFLESFEKYINKSPVKNIVKKQPVQKTLKTGILQAKTKHNRKKSHAKVAQKRKMSKREKSNFASDNEADDESDESILQPKIPRKEDKRKSFLDTFIAHCDNTPQLKGFYSDKSALVVPKQAVETNCNDPVKKEKGQVKKTKKETNSSGNVKKGTKVLSKPTRKRKVKSTEGNVVSKEEDSIECKSPASTAHRLVEKSEEVTSSTSAAEHADTEMMHKNKAEETHPTGEVRTILESKDSSAMEHGVKADLPTARPTSFESLQTYIDSMSNSASPTASVDSTTSKEIPSKKSVLKISKSMASTFQDSFMTYLGSSSTKSKRDVKKASESCSSSDCGDVKSCNSSVCDGETSEIKKPRGQKPRSSKPFTWDMDSGDEHLDLLLSAHGRVVSEVIDSANTANQGGTCSEGGESGSGQGNKNLIERIIPQSHNQGKSKVRRIYHDGKIWEIGHGSVTSVSVVQPELGGGEKLQSIDGPVNTIPDSNDGGSKDCQPPDNSSSKSVDQQQQALKPEQGPCKIEQQHLSKTPKSDHLPNASTNVEMIRVDRKHDSDGFVRLNKSEADHYDKVNTYTSVTLEDIKKVENTQKGSKWKVKTEKRCSSTKEFPFVFKKNRRT